MTRYSRMHLPPEVAMGNVDAIDLEEKSRIAEGLALIAVIDERRDYLATGYPCMRNYCVGRLRMSEDKGLRRIQVARVALRCPEVFEFLADGRLSVTTAAVLAPHLEPETAAGLLAASAFRTQREIVQMLAEGSRAPVASLAAAAGESLVETTSCQYAAPHAISHLNHCNGVSGDGAGQRPAHVEHPRRGRGDAQRIGRVRRAAVDHRSRARGVGPGAGVARSRGALGRPGAGLRTGDHALPRAPREAAPGREARCGGRSEQCEGPGDPKADAAPRLGA